MELGWRLIEYFACGLYFLNGSQTLLCLRNGFTKQNFGWHLFHLQTHWHTPKAAL